MCYFDVSSLFTNVPLLETIHFICDYIDSHDINLALHTSILRELLLRCTLNIQFKFDGRLYRQTDGVAMGSPLGPLLSDIFMSSLERGSLTPCAFTVDSSTIFSSLLIIKLMQTPS